MSLIEQVRRNSAIWRQNGWNREADVMDTAGDRLEAMQAEIDRLKAEIARLRNIMNEDGLHDPELAKLAGERRDALEASNEEGGRKFRASLDRQGK